MSPESILGETVIITGQMLGQTKAINQQLKSEALANIVSADRIQELPDANAAEAISRLPGVAINRSGGEGNKVVIRGMQPKFAAITVNGIRLPSNSGSDRSVDLSLISPELLDGIEVFKSPLPDMDAEAVGGTVNLRLRKAPKDFKMLAKVLGGYNSLNNDLRDNKEILQFSNRIFKDRVGFVAQASLERFNRGVDIIENGWRAGQTTDDGITQIFGSSLTHIDRQEKRRRQNASLSLDMNVGEGSLAFFGLYSRTSRNRFSMEESYNPGNPSIEVLGNDIENSIQLVSYSLQGEHPIGKLLVDWTAATTQSNGDTPYNFSMRFDNNGQLFEPGLDVNAQPRTFYSASVLDLPNSYLARNEQNISAVQERTNTASLNFKLPYKINDNFNGYFKVGGKYTSIQRERTASRRAENFYYLGGQFTRDASNAYNGELLRLEQNPDLISYSSFDTEENNLNFISEEGEEIGLKASLDPELMRDWYEAQKDLLNTDRSVLVENYTVDETVSAAYAMLKIELFKKISIIPGFRYEYSDNTYNAGLSTVNGRYGVNGFFIDTTSFQQYGEFLPHLHFKYQILEWLDLRASYSATLARPDFTYITPRIRINDTGTTILAGNQNLKHARSTNYDVFLSAYKGKFGLLSFGVFYKEIANIFYPWQTRLFDDETAAQFGFPERRGYTLNSYINSESSTVQGFEVDLQTNLRFLPGLFKGFVINVNYARLYSDTETFFLTSETKLLPGFPPRIETIYTNNSRRVPLPNQAPHVLNMSLGYDLKGFSARISGSFQGNKSESYSANKDFDRFTKSFWRWDASIKQKFGEGWSVFVNMNNISNQQDITFIRNTTYLSGVETYGPTYTGGIQYAIR
jgi:TonB-dependent receptor